jgi:hypothetical protein
MQTFLESCEGQLQALQAAIDHDLMGRLGLLSDVQHSLDGEVFSDVYATASWPVRLQQVTDDADATQTLTLTLTLTLYPYPSPLPLTPTPNQVSDEADRQLDADRMTFQQQLRDDQDALSAELEVTRTP